MIILNVNGLNDTIKRQRSTYWTKKLNRTNCAAMISTEISGELTPERMKRQSQSKNNTQLWMWLVMEVKPDAVKSNIA